MNQINHQLVELCDAFVDSTREAIDCLFPEGVINEKLDKGMEEIHLDHGALITVNSANDIYHFVMFTSQKGCQKITKAIYEGLGDELDAKTLTEDTMCEIINIVAGNLQSDHADALGLISLGLPVYIDSCRFNLFDADKAERAFEIDGEAFQLAIMKRVGKAGEHASR